MTSGRFLFLSLLITAFAFSPVFSQSDGDLVLLRDLVVAVSEEPDTTKEEVPEALMEIVADYYAEQVVPENVPSDVLSYMTGVYREHGYDEYGVWAPVYEPRVPSSPDRRPGLGGTGGGYTSRFSTYKVPPGFRFPSYGMNDFRMPTNGRYTSFFGYRPKFGRMHKGVDIALKVGDTVRSVLPGVVVRIKNDPTGYGNYVVVSHGGDLETLYAHLTKELVVSGQQLKAGDAVGLGGTTGNATGPHLHFETRVKGEAIDPLYYLPRKVERK